MRFNFSAMEVEGDDIGSVSRRRSRPTDPDRIRFSNGDIVEENSSRLTGTDARDGEAEFGIPVDHGVENLDIAPVNNPFRAMGEPITMPGSKLASLNEYDPAQWQKFVSGSKTATYKDEAVTCKKDSTNRPVCRLINESTASSRQAGSVADMQRAADAFLNHIPMFESLNTAVPFSGAKIPGAAVVKTVIQMAGGGLPNPIGARAGYDGWVGPSTFGLTMLAIAIASDLNPQGLNAEVRAVAAANALSEAAMARYSAGIASFLNDCAENFDGLLDQYRQDPPPSPMLVPESLPIFKKKSWIPQIAFGAACALFVWAAFGQKKADKLRHGDPKKDIYSPGKIDPMSGIGS